MGENIKIILSRTNCRSAVVKGMNRHYDIEIQDEFEDTKGVMRIRISNDNTMAKGTNNDLQNIHIKLKIEFHEPHKKPRVNPGAPKG
jgi:acid stress-induced BolA-like protein IbaG/YrbA